MIYSDIEDESHLNTNTAGYVGNLIGTALYWRPTLDVVDATGAYTNVSDDYLNPQELLDAYDDNTFTKRLLANVNVSFALNDNVTFRTIYGVDSSTSAREAQLSPSMDIRDTARADGKRGQASIYNDDRLNRTFENTLNYVSNLNGVDVNLLAGYSYYSYVSEGSVLHAKGFNADQVNLIDNIGGVVDVAEAYSIGSYKNETELQSFFARASLTYDKLLATLTYE